MRKICPVCNKDFESFYHSRKYCSIDCRKKVHTDLIKKNSYRNKKIKICLKCKISKPSSSSSWYCNKCNKIVLKEQYGKHKERTRKNSLVRHSILRDNPEYKRKRNDRYKIYHKKRRENDVQFNTAIRLRCLLYNALKRYTEKGKAFSSIKYGIDFNAIIDYLKPFPKDIKNWHIDHIKPLSSFDLENSEEIKKAFAPENHQWLLEADNISKGNKIN